MNSKYFLPPSNRWDNRKSRVWFQTIFGMSTEINYIFGFCVVYTEKNYLHITVGENIKQRLKDYFLMKKKIKSFHSGLVILLGFSFSFSLQSTKYFGKFTLTPKTSVFYQTLEDFGWVTKKFIWSPLWLCNILRDPFPSPPLSLAVNWQSNFYSTLRDTLLVTTNPPLRSPWKLCDLPKKCPITPPQEMHNDSPSGVVNSKTFNAQISAISHPKTLRCLWRHHHHMHEAKRLWIGNSGPTELTVLLKTDGCLLNTRYVPICFLLGGPIFHSFLQVLSGRLRDA